jgi:hypothetical protein
MVDTTAALAACFADLASSDRGHLALSLRNGIWRSMGAFGTRECVRAGEVTRGHRCRARLAILAIEHVLLIFDRENARSKIGPLASPEDEPAKVLGIASQRLSGSLAWDAARDRFRRYGNFLQYTSELEPEYRRAVLILHGAGSALGVAVRDIELQDEDVRIESPENFWSPDMYACVAATGGVAPWDRPSDQDEARRAFWTWYLRDAVTQALDES